MHIYQVQLWPNGRWDRQPWRKIAAGSEEEAAFKATGERLTKEAQHGRIRVRVMKDAPYGPPASVYYAH